MQSGTKTLSYDDNGNLAGDQTRAFGYDAENALITANATGAALAYRYDGLGRMNRRQARPRARGRTQTRGAGARRDAPRAGASRGGPPRRSPAELSNLDDLEEEPASVAKVERLRP
jgi:hypothetical protein